MREIFKMMVTAGVLISLVLAAGHLVSGYQHRAWKNIGRFTIIKITDKVDIESVDPTSKLGTHLILPSDIQINTLKQRGEWKAKSLAQLGGKYGWKWAGDSIADYLGIAYTGIWRELGIWDKLAWWNLARQAKWKNADLTGTNLLVANNTWDNEQVLGVSDLWGDKARELFYASDLGSSGTEIRVWNSTDEPGLAGKAAAVLGSAGLAVIQVGERESNVIGCEIVSSGTFARNVAVRWMKAILTCSWKEDEMLGNLVEVYLGPGYAARYKN